MVGGAPARDVAFGAGCCTGRGQGQGLDTGGQPNRGAQSQKPEVIVMVPQVASVAGVGHREAAASDLFRPVQFAQAVFPQAHPVPARGARRVVGGLSQGSQTPCPSLPLRTLMAVLSLLHSLALTVSSYLLVSTSIAIAASLASILSPLSKPLCHFLTLILSAGDAHGAGTSVSPVHCPVPTTQQKAGHQHCQLSEGGNKE